MKKVEEKLSRQRLYSVSFFSVSVLLVCWRQFCFKNVASSFIWNAFGLAFFFFDSLTLKGEQFIVALLSLRIGEFIAFNCETFFLSLENISKGRWSSVFCFGGDKKIHCFAFALSTFASIESLCGICVSLRDAIGVFHFVLRPNSSVYWCTLINFFFVLCRFFAPNFNWFH